MLTNIEHKAILPYEETFGQTWEEPRKSSHVSNHSPPSQPSQEESRPRTGAWRRWGALRSLWEGDTHLRCTHQGHAAKHIGTDVHAVREGWRWLISQAVLRLKDFLLRMLSQRRWGDGWVLLSEGRRKSKAEETVLVLHPSGWGLSVCPLAWEAGSVFIVVSGFPALRTLAQKACSESKHWIPLQSCHFGLLRVWSPADPSVVDPHHCTPWQRNRLRRPWVWCSMCLISGMRNKRMELGCESYPGSRSRVRRVRATPPPLPPFSSSFHSARPTSYLPWQRVPRTQDAVTHSPTLTEDQMPAPLG